MGNKVYNFFTGNANKERDGITKERARKEKPLTFGNFFGYFKRNFLTISTSNLLFALCNIWVIFVLLGTSGNFDTYTTTAANPAYAVLYGAMGYNQSPLTAALSNVIGVTTSLKIWSTTSIILVGLVFLSLATNGISNVGMFYMLRSTVNGDYGTAASDFFHAIRKNLKQGIIFGIIDVIVSVMLVYDFFAYQVNSGIGFVYQVGFYLIIAVSLIYIVMRPYIYLMIISFDMSLGKIIKNAFLLTSLGIKRNLVSLIGIALTIALNFFILIFLQGVGFLLPFMITIALCGFIGVYTAWPVVDKYIVQAYYKDHPEERPKKAEDAAIDE